MTHLDLFLAALSIEDRNAWLDWRAMDDAADAARDAADDVEGDDDIDPDAWQVGQDRYERAMGW